MLTETCAIIDERLTDKLMINIPYTKMANRPRPMTKDCLRTLPHTTPLQALNHENNTNYSNLSVKQFLSFTGLPLAYEMINQNTFFFFLTQFSVTHRLLFMYIFQLGNWGNVMMTASTDKPSLVTTYNSRHTYQSYLRVLTSGNPGIV